MLKLEVGISSSCSRVLEGFRADGVPGSGPKHIGSGAPDRVSGL